MFRTHVNYLHEAIIRCVFLVLSHTNSPFGVDKGRRCPLCASVDVAVVRKKKTSAQFTSRHLVKLLDGEVDDAVASVPEEMVLFWIHHNHHHFDRFRPLSFFASCGGDAS